MSALHGVNRLLGDSRVVDLADYERRGGGVGLRAARQRSREEVIAMVAAAGLRGRGGAGFPTGEKWRTVATRARPDTSLPVIVNAAEGEPGTFKDRSLLRRNPYSVLEGSLIAAHAVGGDSIIVAIKASFTNEIARLRASIEETRVAGWFGEVSIHLVEGPGEYLYGEETALLEVIDGRPSFPRVAPPYRRGIVEDQENPDGTWRGDGADALVDNVETLANVPGIVALGADWFRSVGTPQSPGTLVCTVTGDTKRHGVGEFPMGTTLRTVIQEVGGGAKSGGAIGMVLSGVSNPPLGADELDTPLTYEDMAAAGSGLGSASFIVIDRDVPLTAVAAGVARFLGVESCGQCEPCKRDGLAIAAGLAGAPTSAALTEVWDRLGTVTRGARCALAGQTERVVGSILAMASTQAQQASPGPAFAIVPLVDIVGGRATLDDSHRAKRADWSYPGDGSDSHAWPVQRLADQPVQIRPPQTPERPPTPGSGAARAPSSETDPFGALRDLNRELRRAIGAARRADGTERIDTLVSLRSNVRRHMLVTERLIYPLISHLDPRRGDDVFWYPEHHERRARQLLDHIDDLGQDALAPATDDLCHELQLALDELEMRVLPVLLDAIGDDTGEALRIASGLDEMIMEP